MENNEKQANDNNGLKKEGKNPESCCHSNLFSDCSKYLLYIIIGLGFLFLYNITMLWNTGDILETRIQAMEAAAIPVDITVTIITVTDCDACLDIHDVVAKVGALNVNITMQTELESDSEEAQALIVEYQIKTLPAIILGFDPVMAVKTKPEVLKQIEALGFENVDDETDYTPSSAGYKYESIIPPYFDVETNEIKGLVTVISITTPDCEECLGLDAMITALEDALTVEEVVEAEYESAGAIAYLEKYSIENVPTIIISEDAGVYEGFAKAWATYGSEEDDGSFVLRNNFPPYIDTATGEIQGLVDIIYLTDESCTDCYNVSVHKTILRGFGIVLGEETTIDIADAEGQKLLEKYNITKVPTIVLSSDAGAYSLLEQVWAQVGVIAEDMSYIFTAMEQLQGAKYTDLSEENEESSV